MRASAESAVQAIAAVCAAVVLHSLAAVAVAHYTGSEVARPQDAGGATFVLGRSWERVRPHIECLGGIYVQTTLPSSPVPRPLPERRTVPETSPEQLEAEIAALSWLEAHQLKDGSWTEDARGDSCTCQLQPPSGRITETSLGLLAFLAQGYTHLSKVTHRNPLDGRTYAPGQVVKGALKWLIVRGPTPGVRIELTAEEEALGALALTEAYLLTESALFLDSASQWLRVVRERLESTPPGHLDASVAGFALKALFAAEESRNGRLSQGKSWRKPLLDHLEGVPELRGSALRAAARVLGSGDRLAEDGHPDVVALRTLPVPEDPRGYEDWYHGVFAVRLLETQDSAVWLKWRRGVRGMLIETHLRSAPGCRTGSWTPGPGWSRAGVTALNLLTLSCDRRHAPRPAK